MLKLNDRKFEMSQHVLYIVFSNYTGLCRGEDKLDRTGIKPSKWENIKEAEDV